MMPTMLDWLENIADENPLNSVKMVAISALLSVLGDGGR
jgi:hypothetical protein